MKADSLDDRDAQLKEILDRLFTFVAVISPDGIILDINQPPLDVTGLKREEVVGRYVWENAVWTNDPELQQRVKDAMCRAAAGEIVRLDLPVRITDVQTWVMDICVNPVMGTDGKVVKVVASAVDVSARLKSQEEARRLRDELAHVLRLRTAGEMATSIAHEVSQPLTAIITSLHAMRSILGRTQIAVDSQLMQLLTPTLLLA